MHPAAKKPPALLLRVIFIYIVLIAANLGAWGWALIAFRHFPVLLGTSLLAYGFGLRHAVDADHIAAIDNVTRKLMQGGKRPVGIGFYFSLGHSTIVVLATIAVAATATAVQARFGGFQAVGGVVGTLVSGCFLLAIAASNLLILRGTWQQFQDVRAGRVAGAEIDTCFSGGGLLARIFRPLFGMITQSWHMYPLGVLFGLGFDTATEVGLLGISAASAAKGLPIWSILVFPALFTAGMALVDATDSILMLGAYGWAFVRPLRKLYYNMTITLLSAMVAVIVGGIEVLGLVGGQFGLRGRFWNWLGWMNGHFGTLGFGIVGLFIAGWIVSALVYRLRGYHRLEAEVFVP